MCWLYSSKLFCLSRPIVATCSLHCLSSFNFLWYARRISWMNRSRYSFRSLPKWMLSNALMKFPFANRAMCAASCLDSPYCLVKAAAMQSSSIRGILIRCVRLRMVGRIASGFSDTRRNTVCEGGSSSSFNSLLEQVELVQKYLMQ